MPHLLHEAAKRNFAYTADELWASSTMANEITLYKQNVQRIPRKTFSVFRTAKKFPRGSNNNMKDNMGNSNAEKAIVCSTYELINFSLYCKKLCNTR